MRLTIAFENFKALCFVKSRNLANNFDENSKNRFELYVQRVIINSCTSTDQ